MSTFLLKMFTLLSNKLNAYIERRKPDSKDNVLLTVHGSGPAMFLPCSCKLLRLMQVILSKNFQFSNSIRMSG